MKKFLYSFLGTIAGIWISILLGGILMIFSIVAITSNTSSSTEVKEHSVLRINLSGTIVDHPVDINFYDIVNGAVEGQLSLSDIINSINAAKEDKNIDGIYLDCRGASAGLAQSQAIINALTDFKDSGKWVWAYSDNYTQGNYFIASVADSLFLNPVGMIDLHGLSSNVFLFKDLLDKIGVEVQVVKVGTYKSAVEPFILNDISDANKEQQLHFLTRIWENISKSIAQHRGLTIDSINSLANNYCFTKDAKFHDQTNLVDTLLYRRQVEDLMLAKTGVEKLQFVDFSNYSLSQLEQQIVQSSDNSKKKIAVLYAVGDITESADDGIASDRLVPQILDLIKDESIDGLILRVNSGGGSAFASEQIWEALEQFKSITKKPFYVSMGDMAASGGYYISCGADSIYAEPVTLTGSIGIFGMIPNFQPLLKDKLGVNIATVSTNKGGLPELWVPMTNEQKAAMQSYVNRGYDLFVSRCAYGRNMSVDSLYAIAEGRVWDGTSALELGLVDKLGGLETAIEDMAKALGSTLEDIVLVNYPEISLQWWQPLLTMNEVATTIMNNQISSEELYLKLYKRVRNLYPLQCRANIILIK